MRIYKYSMRFGVPALDQSDCSICYNYDLGDLELKHSSTCWNLNNDCPPTCKEKLGGNKLWLWILFILPFRATCVLYPCYMCLVGMVNGCGYDIQQKCTIYEVCRPYYSIWSKLRPVFHQVQQNCYAYELLRCLDVQIWWYFVDDNNNDRTINYCFTSYTYTWGIMSAGWHTIKIVYVARWYANIYKGYGDRCMDAHRLHERVLRKSCTFLGRGTTSIRETS